MKLLLGLNYLINSFIIVLIMSSVGDGLVNSINDWLLLVIVVVYIAVGGGLIWSSYD